MVVDFAVLPVPPFQGFATAAAQPPAYQAHDRPYASSWSPTVVCVCASSVLPFFGSA